MESLEAWKKKATHYYEMPLVDLVHEAQICHRNNFDPKKIQASQLLSIKTGSCPEDCAYCPQSAHYSTGVEKESLLTVGAVEKAAKQAKASGATRFCMGAAWREVKDGPQFNTVLDMVRAVTGLGLECCCTLGMITEQQAKELKKAGLYAYNHNIDSSREYYEKIISTRSYEDRLSTIANVRKAGITVCTGGILGMGESDEDRVQFLAQLACFKPQPESVTINTLVPIRGTPLGEQKPISKIIILRVIATARLMMPKSMLRLSAGRMEMTEVEQFSCFLVGANSIFLGDKLLTSPNPSLQADQKMLESFGMHLC